MLGICVVAAADAALGSLSRLWEPSATLGFQSKVGTLSFLLNTIWYAYHGEDQDNLYMAVALVRSLRNQNALCMWYTW